MALGGFMGTDPTITVDAFADLVESGAVRFVLVSGSNASGTTGAVVATGRSAGRAAGPAAGSVAGAATTGGPVVGPVVGLGAGPVAGPATIGGSGGAAGSAILSVVAAACTPVTASSTNGAVRTAYASSLVDCADRAAAIRAGAA